MAKFGDRLFGKIGDVVIAHWKGKRYIRSKPSGNPSNTKAQQNQRSKFGMVVKFVGRILPVINAGFKWRTDEMTERNAAISYLMKNAVRGEKPNIQIDYSAVLVARGDLPPPNAPAAERIADDLLKIEWQPDSELDNNRSTDNVLVLAYFPEIKQGIWSIGGTNRADGEMSLHLPESTVDKEMHVYLAFASVNGNDASDSVYLGQM